MRREEAKKRQGDFCGSTNINGGKGGEEKRDRRSKMAANKSSVEREMRGRRKRTL